MTAFEETENMKDHFINGWEEKQKLFDRDVSCSCPGDDIDYHPDYKGICAACGRPVNKGGNNGHRRR